MFKTKRESKKRKRELASIFLLTLFFIALAWFEFRVFFTSQELPFVYSIFFFGLVNFNLVLLLLLLFLIFRNLFKAFVEKQHGVTGSSLRSRLVITFFVFSSVPTILMFFVSVIYINTSFDKWFSEKMTTVMKSALEVTRQYYTDTKTRNFYAADKISKKLQFAGNNSEILYILRQQQDVYNLDAIEYYDDLFDERVIVVSGDRTIPEISRASVEFLQKGIRESQESSTIQEYTKGNLIRTMVPIKGKKAVVVTATYVPFSLLKRMNNIGLIYEELKGTSNPIQYPLKSIYIIILILMTLVILFCATWFGFYMAKHLSDALSRLSQATRRIAQGDYAPVEITHGETEVRDLAENFNIMASQLEKSQKDVIDANENLRQTLGHLDERSRYIEVILSNVSTGVISLDKNDKITTINDRAESLFKIKADEFVGKELKDVIGEKYYRFYRQMFLNMSQYNIAKMTRQLEMQIGETSFPSLLTISRLIDDDEEEWGKVIGFDDLTDVLKSQKIEAWKEVARRIAHEIKNPLTPIKLSAQRLQKKFGNEIEDEAFGACTDMIIQQADAMKKLVNEFSEYARMPVLKRENNNINDLILSVVGLYQQAYKNVEFVCNLDERVGAFLFDMEQMKRVLINLIENAVAAMGEAPGAKIEISTHADKARHIVQLSVADNGPGVEESKYAKLFEPYYSTKKSGSGLGLAIVSKVVEDHKGVIQACSNPGGGLRFNIELPQSSKDSHV